MKARIRKKGPKLEQLLTAVTDDNINAEWETGAAVGREAW